MRLYISIILALLPIMSFSLQRVYSKKAGTYDNFRKIFSVYYVDWLFMPFNLLLFFTTTLNSYTPLILLLSLLGNILIHKMWAKIGTYMHQSNGSLSKAGIVHLSFSTVQAALIIVFFLFSMKNIYFYIQSSILLTFFIGGLYSSKRVHDKPLLSDILAMSAGIIAIILKIIL